MALKLVLTLLLAAGFFIIFKINPLAWIPKLRSFRLPKAEKKETAKEFIKRLEGKKKENVIRRNLNEAKDALTVIGQAEKYRNKTKISLFCGAAGGIVSYFAFRSYLLMAVIGYGSAMLPLWLIQLKVYEFTRHVNNELETVLSMVTTSYMRDNDIVRAAEEAAPLAKAPVKGIMQDFVWSVKYVNPSIEEGILQMQQKLDNSLFQQWCDTLYLCQSDHTLKYGLLPIIERFSSLKKYQAKNETKMMQPFSETIQLLIIIGLILGIIFLGNKDWFYNLTHTFAGQVALSAECMVAFATVQKAIKLSKPVEYRI